jgi:hyperosmotically inducible protein
MLLRLLLLVVLVFVAVWVVQNVDFDRDGIRAGGEVGRAAERAGDKVGDAVRGIDAEEIARELKETGRVVRRKTSQAARELADATRDGRTSAAIKAKLALDPRLSALDVSVDTTEGVVTLAGRVDAPQDVARAIELALEQDNVREVISTLQVRPRREPAPERD